MIHLNLTLPKRPFYRVTFLVLVQVQARHKVANPVKVAKVVKAANRQDKLGPTRLKILIY